MIKRRFYRQDHGERDGASSDSSSSSDSDLEAQSSPDSDAESQPQPNPEAASDADADNEDDNNDDNDDDGHASVRPELPSSSSSGSLLPTSLHLQNPFSFGSCYNLIHSWAPSLQDTRVKIALQMKLPLIQRVMH